MFQMLALRAGLLQVMDGMNGECDEVPHNATLCLIAFASKSLLSAELCYNNMELEALEILHSIEVPP